MQCEMIKIKERQNRSTMKRKMKRCKTYTIKPYHHACSSFTVKNQLNSVCLSQVSFYHDCFVLIEKKCSSAMHVFFLCSNIWGFKWHHTKAFKTIHQLATWYIYASSLSEIEQMPFRFERMLNFTLHLDKAQLRPQYRKERFPSEMVIGERRSWIGAPQIFLSIHRKIVLPNTASHYFDAKYRKENTQGYIKNTALSCSWGETIDKTSGFFRKKRCFWINVQLIINEQSFCGSGSGSRSEVDFRVQTICTN